ncbi:hypothetical protein QIG88_27950, partial [Klebsiella pneumoniae]|nr:hypothetical protein [Klebsiella pneumoniae]
SDASMMRTPVSSANMARHADAMIGWSSTISIRNGPRREVLWFGRAEAAFMRTVAISDPGMIDMIRRRAFWLVNREQ